jgi:hypothetical protein
MTWNRSTDDQPPAPEPTAEPAPEPATESHAPASEAPEHDWAAARGLLLPLLCPPGTHGTNLSEVDVGELSAEGLRTHARPVVDPGPVDTVIAYAIRGGGFDVLVNADHLLEWGIGPDQLREAATANLAAWSSRAPWREELSGERRLLVSDTGEGADAARILLPDVRSRLVADLGSAGRILIGLPNRHLLLAAALSPDDPDFTGQFEAFVGDLNESADEPIDSRVLELVNGELVPFETPAG